MKTNHKLIANEVGRSHKRADTYEESIDSLGNEELIAKMIQERMAVLVDPIGPNYMRNLVIHGILLEQLRRSKLGLQPGDTDWATYADEQ